MFVAPRPVVASTPRRTQSLWAIATDPHHHPIAPKRPVGFYTRAAMEKQSDLIDEAWGLLSSGGGAVVRPSVPILWFGDSVAFSNSGVRVVTVGLNPSRVEFPEGDRFLRFPAARLLTTPPATALQRLAYVSALDSYFRAAPYRRWFDQGFERGLNGLSATYYQGLPNVALHTDLLSLLATDPTWSRLANDERASLAHGGPPLWHKLIRLLRPDVVVASVAREHLDRILFPRLGSWRVIHTVDRDRPFVTEAVDIEVVPGKRTLLVFGRCVSIPFGSVSHQSKLAIGSAIAADRA